ncbi:MAG: hypothetical protein ACSHYF_04315 [Verrucomicrobiaceae bacterium]
MKTSRLFLTVIVGGALVSCTQTQQQYGAGGALAGAAAGALLGDDSSDVIRGAAIGGAAGVGTAAYKENQNRKAGAYNTGGDYQTPVPQAPGYLKGTPTNRAGIVRSPHAPYHEVNVSTFKSGELARDPYTKEVFLVP